MESFGLTRPSEAPAPTLSEAIDQDRAAEGASPVRVAEQHTVLCPGCSTKYGVPAGLMPPWGARIRCPRCAREFSAGPLAEAERIIEAMRIEDPEAWEHACIDRNLWGMWGERLLEGYQDLRRRLGAPIASRAFRRALEYAAPGVPWFAPPDPPSPLEGPVEGGEVTLFERRRAE